MSKEDILIRILKKQVSSCSCGTKAPDWKYHDENCLYAVLAEAYEEILVWRPSETIFSKSERP